MPAVAEYVAPMNPLANWIVDLELSLQPQGSEGRLVRAKADEAFLHWIERAEILNASIGLVIVGGDSGTVPYDSVPPPRTFYVKTRYVFRGKGEPMPFELDDE